MDIKIISKKLCENRESPPQYDIDIKFPKMENINKDFAEINVFIKGYIMKLFLEHRKFALQRNLQTSPYYGNDSFIGTMGLMVEYDIKLFNDNFFSLSFKCFRYFPGTAHPQHFTNTFNFRLKPVILLEISDIFKSEANYLNFLSNYCVNDLIKQANTDGYNTDTNNLWINEESFPKPDYFEKFNLTENSLIITFDEYEVGPYSWGDREVIIPFNLIRHIINPDLKLFPDNL